jgi:hypothetical protein
VRRLEWAKAIPELTDRWVQSFGSLRSGMADGVTFALQATGTSALGGTGRRSRLLARIPACNNCQRLEQQAHELTVLFPAAKKKRCGLQDVRSQIEIFSVAAWSNLVNHNATHIVCVEQVYAHATARRA